MFKQYLHPLKLKQHRVAMNPTKMVMRNGSALSETGADTDGGAGDQVPGTSQPIRVEELDHFDEDWIMPFPLKDGVHVRKGVKFSDYYTLHEEIGEGKFGKVYRCVEKGTGLVLAAKCIKIRKDTDFEKVEKEVNIMTQMRHKCIAQIYDAFATDSNDVILIMEMVQGGELFDRIADDSYILTEMAVALIMLQICEAIRYIHSQHIIHLDLKPENIMCVSQTSNKIKLIDFGLAQWYDGSKDLLFMAGTPEFAAPEVIKYEPLDFHTDMWSLGVIAYILLSGQSPFLGETLAHTYCNVEKGQWRFCEEFTDNGISTDAKDFITRLLVLEKEKRMLPDECLAHPWIVRNRERALINASRAVSPAVCQPLAVEKLRSYVKNKRFRRLVFGVLFVNSVMRMIQTLQRNKSAHGIEYVRNMLSAVEDQGKEEAESNLLLKAFTKKKIRKTDVAAVVAEHVHKEVEEEVENEREDVKKAVPEEKMELDEQPKEESAEPEVKERKRVVKKVRVPGEKKKRSKSEARRAAEQQRTRSSTEQTSSKKQRQEAEAETEEEPEVPKRTEERRQKLKTFRPETEKAEKAKENKEATETIKMEWEMVKDRLKSVKPEAHKEAAQNNRVEKAAQWEKEREKLRNIKQDMDRRRDDEQHTKPSTKLGQVAKMAQRMEKRAEETPAAVPSTSAAGRTVPSSLVGNMLKRLEGDSGARQPLAFAVAAAVPQKKEAVEVKTRREEVKTRQKPEESKEEASNWREDIRRREQADLEKQQRAEQRKKQVKLVKRKVRRVRTADEEMAQERGAAKVPNGKAAAKDIEMQDEDRQIAIVVERTRERVKRETEGEKLLGRREAAVNGHTNGFGLQKCKQRLKPRRAATDEEEAAEAGWSIVGQDVFDFSLLRMKLQNRIMGLKDRDELETEAENKQKFELQKQQKELQTNLNIKRAMRKWITLDRETRQQQTGRSKGGQPECIPDWAR